MAIAVTNKDYEARIDVEHISKERRIMREIHYQKQKGIFKGIDRTGV